MHRNPSGPAANPIGNPAQRPRLGESPERDRGLVQQFLNHGFQGPFSAALPLLWSLFPDVITPPPLRIPRSPHLAAAMRALLSGAAAAALSALFAGPAAAQFTWGWRMGGPEEIHNEGKNPVQPWHVFPDGGISTLRGSNGNFISFWSNAENYRTEGPTALLEDQWQNVPYTPWPMIYYGGRVDYPAFYNGGRWLLSVHKHPTDGNPRHLVAFVHAEDAYWPRHIAGGPNWKSIMVSHSFDEGLTWEDRGQIITHNHPRPSDADSWDSSKIRTTTGGLGNHAAIWDAPNGRWVIIFEGNWKGVAISYDPDGNPGSWLKWNGPAEGFSQPGIGGAWARIPALQSLTGTNPMISYNEYLGRYLVMYGLWLSRGAYMVITATNDFVNWETPRVFARSVDGTRAWFPTLINEAYGSFRSAQYNWLYYGDKFEVPRTDKRQLMKRYVEFCLGEGCGDGSSYSIAVSEQGTGNSLTNIQNDIDGAAAGQNLGRPIGAACTASDQQCTTTCCVNGLCADRSLCVAGGGGSSSSSSGKPDGAGCSASGPECTSGCCVNAVCTVRNVCFGDGPAPSSPGKPDGAGCSSSGPECSSGCCVNAVCTVRTVCFG